MVSTLINLQANIYATAMLGRQTELNIVTLLRHFTSRNWEVVQNVEYKSIIFNLYTSDFKKLDRTLLLNNN